MSGKTYQGLWLLLPLAWAAGWAALGWAFDPESHIVRGTFVSVVEEGQRRAGSGALGLAVGGLCGAACGLLVLATDRRSALVWMACSLLCGALTASLCQVVHTTYHPYLTYGEMTGFAEASGIRAELPTCLAAGAALGAVVGAAALVVRAAFLFARHVAERITRPAPDR